MYRKRREEKKRKPGAVTPGLQMVSAFKNRNLTST
jgi:hypothetical protein